MTNPQTSKGYANLLLEAAKEFYLTYIVIKEDQPPKHDFLSMKHYLLCHALELTLKGWLVDTGNYNEEILKRRFGHNLENLADEVNQVYGSPFWRRSPQSHRPVCQGRLCKSTRTCCEA